MLIWIRSPGCQCLAGNTEEDGPLPGDGRLTMYRNVVDDIHLGQHSFANRPSPPSSFDSIGATYPKCYTFVTTLRLAGYCCTGRVFLDRWPPWVSIHVAQSAIRSVLDGRLHE